MTVELDWMRHGKTISNVIRDTEGFAGFFKQAFIGETLHEEGIRQTSQISENPELQNRLNDYDFIFCSMLSRSIQTALILFPKRKIYLAPFLNEYRSWWAMGLDSVNRPPDDLEDLKQKISKFPNVQNISFDYVSEPKEWHDINQSSPEKFYHFLLQDISPKFSKGAHPKILINSHSWYMYYNFNLPLFSLRDNLGKKYKYSIDNNEIWRETGNFEFDSTKKNGGFRRKSIHFIFDPSTQEKKEEEFMSFID